DMIEHLSMVATRARLRVEYRTPELHGAHGYLNRTQRLIVIDPDQPPAMRAKVLAHELGHYFDPILTAAPDLYREHRGDCEAVAQSVADVGAGHLGLDGGPAAVGYVSAWTCGESQRVRELAERIDAATSTILAARTNTRDEQPNEGDAPEGAEDPLTP